MSLFQRDHYCTNCRKQVQAFTARIEEFHERDAEVGEAYDQPVRFGFLDDVSDFLGRMPEAVVLDLWDDEPEIAWAYRGRSTFDRPEVEDLLAELDGLREPDV